MIGTVYEIFNHMIKFKITCSKASLPTLYHAYVLIRDQNHQYIGEVTEVNDLIIGVQILGEYVNGSFILGTSMLPTYNAQLYLISPDFVSKLFSSSRNNLMIGKNAYYENVSVNADIDHFFGGHFSIFGATGFGKSCAFARIIQSLLENGRAAEHAHLVLFDAYGEYKPAFLTLHDNNSKIHFRSFTSDIASLDDEIISIPPWLMDADDYALLLQVEKVVQMPLLEQALRYVTVFAKPEEESMAYQNHLIAKALRDLLISGRDASKIRDQFISILTQYHTSLLNLETEVYDPGYSRPLRLCLNIDNHGNLKDARLLALFLENYLLDDVKISLPDGSFYYTLQDLLYAFDFSLISYGLFQSEEVYELAHALRVRLKTICDSNTLFYFKRESYISRDDYIRSLFFTKEGDFIQLVNFNISTVDDRLAKTITKIYGKLFFNYTKDLASRGSFPIHFILEEAHRFVQNDSDVSIIGYNIFERITKEGRKFGMFLGLISQRPCELSETVLSQCTNFLLFRIGHPKDLDFISSMVPNMTQDKIEVIKELKPGYCLCYGTAFVIPMLAYVSLPNPKPASETVSISKNWFSKT